MLLVLNIILLIVYRLLSNSILINLKSNFELVNLFWLNLLHFKFMKKYIYKSHKCITMWEIFLSKSMCNTKNIKKKL